MTTHSLIFEHGANINNKALLDWNYITCLTLFFIYIRRSQLIFEHSGIIYYCIRNDENISNCPGGLFMHV